MFVNPVYSGNCTPTNVPTDLCNVLENFAYCLLASCENACQFIPVRLLSDYTLNGQTSFDIPNDNEMNACISQRTVSVGVLESNTRA